MVSQAQLPVGIDPNQPSAARIYDCMLGGTHNFAADRAVAARAIELVPELPAAARANRAFLRRAVRFAAERGVRQFLDLGSGIPAEGAVHEVARAVQPGARVVYVDRDPTAVLHGRAATSDDPDTAVIRRDLEEAEEILTDPRVRDLLDFSEPLCVLIIAVLHFVPDSDRLADALRLYHEVSAPGSLLTVTHATGGTRPTGLDRVADLYSRTGTPLVLRDEDQLGAVFAGWDLVDPGLVHCAEWHPDPGTPPVPDLAVFLTLGGVAVRP